MTRADQISQFLIKTGWDKAAQTPMAGDASTRRYVRLTLGDRSAILMDVDPRHAGPIGPFITIAKALRAEGLSAPRIYAVDDPAGLAVIEDLGDALYAKVITEDPSREAPLYTAAIDALWHLHGAKPKLDLPRATPDQLAAMLDPFFTDYPPHSGQAIENKTQTAIAQTMLDLLRRYCDDQSVVILRDFHAENLLWLPDRSGVARVGLLDFQDALWGHPVYDIISLTQDARRDVSGGIEQDMLAHYATLSGRDLSDLARSAAILGVQRNLRILGIFARLAQQRGKPGYLALIPRVLGYLQQGLSHPDLVHLAEHLRPLLKGNRI